MFPDVFALLNTAAVRQYVGTNPPRIYRHGTAPETVAAPYVTWFVVSATPENHLDGTPPVDNVSVQVDAWSNNTGSGAVEVQKLATALRDAIEAAHDIQQFGNDAFDNASGRYRISITFSYWNPR